MTVPPAMPRLLGFALLGLSTTLYSVLLLMPFLPIPVSTETKVAISGGLVVVGEATFWIGGLLVGRELVKRYRDRLNPLRLLRRDERPPDGEPS